MRKAQTQTQSKRVGIFGASGSGKTTKALELVKNCRRLIVFDSLDDFGGKLKRFDCLENIKIYLIKNYIKGFKCCYVPAAGREPQELSALCEFLKDLQKGFKFNQHASKLTLFVDELNLSYPLGISRAQPQNGFTFLNNQGRHYGINVVGVSQRMSLVDLPFRANLSDLFIFRLADYNDIKAACAMIGNKYRENLLNLPRFRYIYKSEIGEVIL